MKISWIGSLLKETYQQWNKNKAPRLAAALAYYTIFSIAPLLIIAISLAGLVFGREAAEGQLIAQIQGTIGPQAATAVQTMVENAGKQKHAGKIATIIGVIVLLVGAAGVFGQLQDALNTIWEVKPSPRRGIWGFVRDRFLSFGMVLGIAFLLLVSLVTSAMLSAATAYLSSPTAVFGQAINLVVSFAVITVLFAMIYKFLPDVKLAWRDTWVGAITTSLLFAAGKFLIGLYLARGSVASAYGAAGSLVILLVWIFYSAQIAFFGAEMTKVYAMKYGRGITPARGASLATNNERAVEGEKSKARP